MRTRQLPANAVALVLLAGAIVAARPQQDAAALQARQYQQALHEMDTRGDCLAAIPLFNRAAEGPDRQLSARSLLYIGVCFETLGRDGADATYRRLLDRYPDQNDVAAEARKRLAALAPRPSRNVRTERVWDSPAHVSGAPSPDGRHVSFPDADSGQLGIRDLATNQSRLITDGKDGYAARSVFSPDGRQLAYVWDMDKGGCDLRIVSTAGGLPRTVYHFDGGPCAHPRDWSDDGSRILALVPISLESNGRRLALINVESGALQPLHDVLDERWPYSAQVSPDGSWVVFDAATRDDGPERDIFIVAANGGTASPLAAHPGYDWSPFWTPDGRHVLFLSDRGRGSMGAWLVRVEAGAAQGEPILVNPDMGRSMLQPLGLTRRGTLFYGLQAGTVDVYEASLTAKASGKPVAPRREGENISPDWSADGRFFAYVAKRGQVPDDWRSNILVIRNLETSDSRELTPPLGFFIKPRWAPDGRTVLLKGALAKGPWGMHAVDPSSGEVVSSFLTDRRFRDVLWTPDGRALVFDAGASVWRYDIPSGSYTEIHRHSAGVFRVALSPDGSQVAFAEVSGKGIWTVLSAGGSAREVFKATGAETLAVWDWTRDGKALLVTRTADADSGKARLWVVPLLTGAAYDTGIAGASLREVRVHPDGVRIAYTVGNPTWELWTMNNFLPPPANGSR